MRRPERQKNSLACSGADKEPPGLWDTAEHRRRFLDTVAAACGVRSARDWKRVTTAEVVAAGGSGLLNKYPSLAAALADVYGGAATEAELRELQERQRVRRGHWEEEEHVRSFARELARDLDLRCTEDWYRVTRCQVAARAGGWSLLQARGLEGLLAAAHPGHRWSRRRLALPFKRAQQAAVCRMLRQLF